MSSPAGRPGAAGLPAAELLDEATAKTGLDDWGGDLGFVSTLELLLESCWETGELTPLGWDVLHKVVVRHLRNRLYVQAFLRARGGYLPAIQAPVVVTGLPRTGTTLLHNLLALDPAHRVLRFWEGLHPVPPDPSRGITEEALVAQAQAWLDRLYALAPRFRAIHGATPTGPEECDALLQNSFASQHFDDMFRAEAYSRWLNNASLLDEYAHYARQLQVLTRPDQEQLRWALKSPSHLGYLDTLRQALPGAVIVQCHRDPCEAVASYASLVLAVRSPYRDAVPLEEVGGHALGRSALATERALRARTGAADHGFVDVAYRRLVDDPLGAVEELYERLGRTLEGEADDAMAAWIAANPRHKHGRHDYSLERFGLSAEAVAERLRPYLDRFGAYAA